MVLEKLFQQLNGLLPSDLGSKIVIISEQVVQPVHGCLCSETAPIDSEMLSMLPQWHPSTEEFGHFIPLQNRTITQVQAAC